VEAKKIKQMTRKEKHQKNNDQLKEIKKKCMDEKALEKGVSNLLNTLPMVEYGFDMTKQQFWDTIRLRYGWSIPNLPMKCSCGEKFYLYNIA